MATFNLSGTDRHGKLFGLYLTDPLAGGFGAFTPELPPAVAATLHPDLAITAWADPATGALLGIHAG
jgi:hypothetical protein